MRISILTICAAATLLAAHLPQATADQLTLQIGDRTVELKGEILIEAQDSSLYFRQDTGKIWFVKPDQIINKIDEEASAEPITKKELGEQLLAELPEGFRIYETKHYVIAYQNELAYARWVGGLYESRLYRGFETFFYRRKKFDLEEPEFPLVAIIFGSKAEYEQFVARELGPGQDMIAYYNVQTNRVAMYDLTAANRIPGQPLDDRRIEQILQSPAAVSMVATIIHEATHQLLFNRGIQTRFADCPLWVNEGLAMYFEAPNVRSRRGWQKPGMIFQQRYVRFRDYLTRRPANSLVTLIQDDRRLRDPDQVLDAYAEAWALNHFLLSQKSDQYVAYLQHLAKNQPLIQLEPEQRVADFKQFMGDDLQQLDQEFQQYILKLQ